MERHTVAYGFGTTVALPHDAALRATRDALAAEGFGVLYEIDVAATLRTKLGVDVGPYVILGACNPPLANAALTIDRDVGLLLPCNVVVYAGSGGERDRCVVAALDPDRALAPTGSDALQPIAAEAKARLERVIAAVADVRAKSPDASLGTSVPAADAVEEIC